MKMDFDGQVRFILFPRTTYFNLRSIQRPSLKSQQVAFLAIPETLSKIVKNQMTGLGFRNRPLYNTYLKKSLFENQTKKAHY